MENHMKLMQSYKTGAEEKSISRNVITKTIDIINNLIENIKNGMSPGESDLALLETARRCDFYGVKLHNAKRRKLLIKLHPESYQYYKETIEFSFESRNECKSFWKKCVEHHAFFRCSEVSPPKKSKEARRTQKQLIDYVRDHHKRREPFTRPIKPGLSSRGSMPHINGHRVSDTGSSSGSRAAVTFPYASYSASAPRPHRHRPSQQNTHPSGAVSDGERMCISDADTSISHAASQTPREYDNVSEESYRLSDHEQRALSHPETVAAQMSSVYATTFTTKRSEGPYQGGRDSHINAYQNITFPSSYPPGSSFYSRKAVGEKRIAYSSSSAPSSSVEYPIHKKLVPVEIDGPNVKLDDYIRREEKRPVVTYGAVGPLPGKVISKENLVVTPEGLREKRVKPAVPPKPKNLTSPSSVVIVRLHQSPVSQLLKVQPALEPCPRRSPRSALAKRGKRGDPRRQTQPVRFNLPPSPEIEHHRVSFASEPNLNDETVDNALCDNLSLQEEGSAAKSITHAPLNRSMSNIENSTIQQEQQEEKKETSVDDDLPPLPPPPPPPPPLVPALFRDPILSEPMPAPPNSSRFLRLWMHLLCRLDLFNKFLSSVSH
uniref:FERM C-terminal PH-like domain-containing protein n=1 Tax=Parascaris equorum TaxID=6256 RepID=A0A914RLF9_PAREQ